MMRLDVPPGILLYCRKCDEEVPHEEYRFPTSLTEGLICPAQHVQSTHQPMVAMGYDSEFSPAILMLPMRCWTAGYIEQRERQQGLYLRTMKG
jgi:hypothetical protein